VAAHPLGTPGLTSGGLIGIGLPSRSPAHSIAGSCTEGILAPVVLIGTDKKRDTFDVNEEGLKLGIDPYENSATHTTLMKTDGLKQALDKYKFDAAFGGARRDEEKSRAKERIFSFRNRNHGWEPKNQRPELWDLYNAKVNQGESIRVFPISNWTELDVWQYIYLEKIPIVPLYFAAPRPVVERDGIMIMVDDDRLKLMPGETPVEKVVRFRTLGCYPLTGAVESTADTLPKIIQEMLLATTSEREGRLIDNDSVGMQKQKEDGYF